MDSKDEATIKLWVAAIIANRDTDAAAVIAERISKLEFEITYLRWFHRNADFGPAHTGVVVAMQAAYPGTVPSTWLCE